MKRTVIECQQHRHCGTRYSYSPDGYGPHRLYAVTDIRFRCCPRCGARVRTLRGMDPAGLPDYAGEHVAADDRMRVASERIAAAQS
jgi:hypothetical protein